MFSFSFHIACSVWLPGISFLVLFYLHWRYRSFAKVTCHRLLLALFKMRRVYRIFTFYLENILGFVLIFFRILLSLWSILRSIGLVISGFCQPLRRCLICRILFLMWFFYRCITCLLSFKVIQGCH